MFVDKNKNNIQQAPNPELPELKPVVAVDEEFSVNPISSMYKAVKDVLSQLTVDENDPSSPPLFKTIKMDNGQLARIKKKYTNEEYGIAFPAVFIHFIDVHYLVSQSRIGEGRGTMRIHYVLNRLNNSDEEAELEGFDVFRRINAALQDNRGNYPALSERFQLEYFEQPLSFDDGLQPYWIDYGIFFSDYTAYNRRNYVERYVVVPPFTNHSDQKPESNTDNHEDHAADIEEAAGFTPIPTE